MEPSFDPTVFTKNRRRLLEHVVAQRFFDEVVRQAAGLGVLGDEPEDVNFFETDRRGNYSGSDTSTGLLIQAGPGNGGGTGAWRTKRSGCAA
jgi:hypothetical protein